MSTFAFVPFVDQSFCPGQTAAYIQEGLFEAGFGRPLIHDVHLFKNRTRAGYNAIVEFLELDKRALQQLRGGKLKLFQKYSYQREMILFPTKRSHPSARAVPRSYDLYPMNF